MASPRSGSSRVALGSYYKGYETVMNNLYNWTTAWADTMRNGTSTELAGLEYMRAAQWITYATQNLEYLNKANTLSGLEAYIRNELTDPTREVVADHVSTRTALINARGWLILNLPTNIQYVENISNEGVVTYARATAAAVEPLALLMDTLKATIED